MGAMGLEEGKYKIDRIEGYDFTFWKTQIEDYLYHKDLYLPLLGKVKGKKADDKKMKIGRFLTGKRWE